MTQKEFLKLLQEKYQFTIKGYGDKEIDIQINPNDKYQYFLIPYTKRTVRNNVYVGKNGEPFTITSFNYTLKNAITGEITHAYIPRSRILFTTLYEKDLIILDQDNNYDKNIAQLIKTYQILTPKRLPLFYRVDKTTFLKDMKGTK